MTQEAGHGSLIDRFLSNDAEENGDEDMCFEEEPDMEANENEGEANDNENEEWGLDESWECEEDQDMGGDLDDRVNQGIKNVFAEFQMSDDAEADDGFYDSVEETAEEAAADCEESGNDHLLEAPRTPEEDASQDEAPAVESRKASRDILHIGRRIEVKRTDGTWSVGKVSECLDAGAMVMMEGARHGQTKMIKWGSQSVWRLCNGDTATANDSTAPSDHQDEHDRSAGDQAEEEEQEEEEEMVETVQGLSVFEVAEEELKQEHDNEQDQEQEAPAPEQEQEQEPEAPAPDQPSSSGVKKPVAKIRPVAKFRVKAHPPPPDPPPPPGQPPPALVAQVQMQNQMQNLIQGGTKIMQAALQMGQQMGFRPPSPMGIQRPPPLFQGNIQQQTTPPSHIGTQPTTFQPRMQSPVQPPPAQPPPAVRPPPQHVRGPHVRGPAPAPAQAPAQVRAPVSKANHFIANAATSSGSAAAPVRPMQPIGAPARMPIGAPFPKGGSTRDLSAPQVQKAPFPKGGIAASGPPPPPPAVTPQPPAPVHPRPAIPKDASAVGTTSDLKSELKAFAIKRNLSDEWVEKVSAWEPKKIRNLLTSRESDETTRASASQETRKPPKQPPVPPPTAMRETATSVASNLSQPPLEPVQKAPRPKWRPTAPEPPWKPPPKNLLAEQATPGGGSNDVSETSDELEQQATRRLEEANFSAKDLNLVDDLKRTTGLEDDTLIGLRFLPKEQFRKLYYHEDLEKRILAEPKEKQREFVIRLVGQIDPSAASLVRKLLKIDGLDEGQPVEPQVGKFSGKVVQPPSGKVVPPPARKGTAGETQTANTPEKAKPPEVPKTTEETSLTLIFSHLCLGKIFGRNGSALTKIREDSGAEVKVSNKAAGKGGEKICEVQIKGPAHAVEAARKGVTEYAGEEPRHDQRLSGEKGKGKEKPPSSSCGKGKGKGKEDILASGGKGNGKGKEEAVASGDKGKGKAIGKPSGKATGKPVTEEKLLKGEKGKGKSTSKSTDVIKIGRADEVAGSKKDPAEKEIMISVGEASLQPILGKSGESVQEVRRKSGASVILKKAFADDGKGGKGKKSFDIRIAGTTEQALSAEKMINDLIAKASNQQAGNWQQSEASSSSSAPKVGANVDRANSDESAKAKPTKGSANDSGVGVKARSRSPRRNNSNDSKADPLKNWLQGLDDSGDMLRYLDLLRKNFSTLSQLTHVLLDTPGNGKTVLSCIEPDFFDVLQVESLGHRLILAKAIVALSSKKT